MSCKCQGCGNRYRVDVGVPDEIWERIKPPGKAEGAGLLCGSCIMARIEEFGEYNAYELTKWIKYETERKIEPKIRGKKIMTLIIIGAVCLVVGAIVGFFIAMALVMS